jgi:hypothetical protein
LIPRDVAAKRLWPPIIVEVRSGTVADILDGIAGSYRQHPPKVWIYQECRSGKETLVDVKMP